MILFTPLAKGTIYRLFNKKIEAKKVRIFNMPNDLHPCWRKPEVDVEAYYDRAVIDSIKKIEAREIAKFPVIGDKVRILDLPTHVKKALDQARESLGAVEFVESEVEVELT